MAGEKKMRLTEKRLKALSLGLALDEILYEKFRRLGKTRVSSSVERKMSEAVSFWAQLDAMVAEHKNAERLAKQSTMKLRGNAMIERGPRTELSLTEIMLIEKLQRSVTFVPASAHKRFVRELSAKSKLSDRGRAYLAYIAHRYRRQWKPSDEEFEWMLRWKNY